MINTYQKLTSLRNKIGFYFLIGALIGFLYALIEYYIKLNTDDVQALMPLILRAMSTGAFIFSSVFVFEKIFNYLFKKKAFIYIVIVRSIAHTIIITVWLTIFNAIWFFINDADFYLELRGYFTGDSFLINMITVATLVIIMVGAQQINSLHRKGELINFILGRFNVPKEVELVFCFIDLTGSTTIAEQLGHKKYALFIKDYYSDITEALEDTHAQVFDYVGDEIILSWNYKDGLKDNNMIMCFFKMKEIIDSLKDKYLSKYGVYPKFKAGIHGGKVIVTWVGEVKKEVVYIGDVLNTTARIQEYCKKLQKDFLISEELLKRTEDLKGIKAVYADETVLRGKNIKTKLYSLE